MMYIFNLHCSPESRKPKAESFVRGVTLIDAVVGAALMLMVFVGIFGVFQLAVDVVSNSKSRAGAIALANERVEYIRSLEYDAVGTAGGIPAGAIPQTEVVSLNNLSYTLRTFIVYVDDPADGLGAEDENGVTVDFKAARVDVEWLSRTGPRNITFVARVSPPGVEVECSDPCGTLIANVVDAAAAPVSGAAVRIVNEGFSPAVDFIAYTNDEGKVSIPGTPVASGYRVFVSKPGYSAAQTYDATEENPSPSPGHLTIGANQTTSSTFAIDLLSELMVKTFRVVEAAEWKDTFSDDSMVVLLENTEVSGGRLRVTGSAPFPPTATAQSVSIIPVNLRQWSEFSWIDSEPGETFVTYHIYDSSGMPIPDTALPGNSDGFTDSPVDISAIPVSEYPSIRIHTVFTNQPPAGVPSVDEWTVTYDHMEPLVNLPFTLRGAKTIGSNPGGAVYKYDEELSSGPSGEITISELEWDTYSITVDAATGYDISSSCAPQPNTIPPNYATTTTLILAAHTPHSLLVDVRNGEGELVPDATVRLYRAEYDETQAADSCGQTFFAGLDSGSVGGGNPYSILVSAAGYQNYEHTEVNVDGTSRVSITLVP